MASGPITSWEIDGETAETVSDFIFLGSKTTADGDGSHEIIEIQNQIQSIGTQLSLTEFLFFIFTQLSPCF